MAGPSRRYQELVAYLDGLDLGLVPLEDEREGLELPKYESLEAELDDSGYDSLEAELDDG